jgi:hypothetical protein
MTISSHMLNKVLAGALVATSGLLASSCTMTLDKNNPLRPPQSQHLSEKQFSDMPVPRSFTLVTGPKKAVGHPGSFSFELPEGSMRMGRFLYSGKGSVESITRYYQDQMQNTYNGWSLVSQDVGRGSAELVFDKGRDRSTVDVFRKGSKTFVLIQVAPRNET